MSPGPTLRRETVWDRLARHYTPYQRREFLCTPQRLLENRIPAELLAKGEGEAIHRLLDQMDDGVYL